MVNDENWNNDSVFKFIPRNCFNRIIVRFKVKLTNWRKYKNARSAYLPRAYNFARAYNQQRAIRNKINDYKNQMLTSEGVLIFHWPQAIKIFNKKYRLKSCMKNNSGNSQLASANG